VKIFQSLGIVRKSDRATQATRASIRLGTAPPETAKNAVEKGCTLLIAVIRSSRLRSEQARGFILSCEKSLIFPAKNHGVIQGCRPARFAENQSQYSHIVIFWTDTPRPDAADKLIAGANKHLRTIPGIRQYQIGRMSPGLRPVVDQSYQVALNLIFPSQQAEQEYQTHPQHLEFVTNFVKPLVKKVVVYDFE
jgi:hypothetical protein